MLLVIIFAILLHDMPPAHLAAKSTSYGRRQGSSTMHCECPQCRSPMPRSNACERCLVLSWPEPWRRQPRGALPEQSRDFSTPVDGRGGGGQAGRRAGGRPGVAGQGACACGKTRLSDTLCVRTPRAAAGGGWLLHTGMRSSRPLSAASASALRSGAEESSVGFQTPTSQVLLHVAADIEAIFATHVAV